VVGDYWPRAAEALAIGDGLWVYDARRQLVWGSSCETGPAPRLGETLEESEIRVLEPDPEAGERSQTTVLATVPGREWTVVVRGSIPSRAPLEGFFSDYWIFVMAMGAMSLIAFALFLRPVTGYVRDLTQAVERVAGGDLRPWFPTPRDDEIGRLSVAFYDMTERLREMVAQVERSSRLAVLGKLSAYLAHEIRNPLSSVQMNLQRLERWRRKGEIPQRFGDAIEISLREVGRLSAAVSNILQLSPSRSRPKELVALHGLMSEVGQLLQPDFARRDVHIMWELNAEVDRVLGDPGQLKSVVINLMLNALDAQPEGGELTVQSRLEPGDREAGGPFLELRFRDRGPGVATEIQDRIFQPFFSTKGEGSGIGLAVVSQTIRNHGGEVYLVERARLAEGAEFVVRLPLAPVVSERSPGRLTPRMTSWMDEPAEE
jgi:signal transduction histidine kinase